MHGQEEYKVGFYPVKLTFKMVYAFILRAFEFNLAVYSLLNRIDRKPFNNQNLI